MKQVFFAIIAFLLLSLPAYAITDAEKQERTQDCSKIRNEKDKKACLDSVSQDEQSTIEADKDKKSKWFINRTKSDFDDSVSIQALLQGQCSDRKCPVLALNCMEGGAYVVILWEGILPFDEKTNVIEYRIDNKKSVREIVEISKDHQATLFKDPLKIAKELNHAKKMVARTEIVGVGTRHVSFDLFGIDDVLKELVTTCKWKLE